jgi:hypothetical protein
MVVGQREVHGAILADRAGPLRIGAPYDGRMTTGQAHMPQHATARRRLSARPDRVDPRGRAALGMVAGGRVRIEGRIGLMRGLLALIMV